MELARYRDNLCQRTRIARRAGIARPSNAASSARSILVVSTRVGRQTDRPLSGQESATALECRTAGLSNYANRRRMGSRGEVRRPCSAQRPECERGELFVKSKASRFQKDQNQPGGRVPIRFAPVESMTIRQNSDRSRRLASRQPLKVEQNKTTRVEKPVPDDHEPKIAARCKNQ